MEKIPDTRGDQDFFREVLDREAWNKVVERLGGSVLQSWAWGQFRSHHGWSPLRLVSADERIAAQVLMRRLPGLGHFAYVPHGPLSDDPAEPADVVGALASCIGRKGGCLLQIEPRIEEERGFKAASFIKTSSLQPRCTFVIEVLENEEKQFAALPKDARYGIRRARREGITVGTSSDASKDLDEFLRLHEETSERQGFALRPREYYRQFMQSLPAHLILARREGGDLLAGAVLVVFGDEAHYLYGASSTESENLYASYLIQHEMLNVARREGVTHYDMGGIPCDPNQEHSLWGVYQFKKKFGGEEKRYVGAYEKSLDPLRAVLVRAGIRSYYSLQRIRGKSSGPLGG